MVDPSFKFTRRKLLAATGAIGVAGAGAGLGTSALFSDTETNSGNTIEAGTLDLRPNGGGSAAVNVSGKAPGDSGSDSFSVNNAGSITGFLSLNFPRGTNRQGSGTDAEPSSSQNGDLGDVLQVTVSLDGTEVRSGTFNGVFDGTRHYYNLPDLAPNDPNPSITLDWTIPLWAGNMVQGDEVEADIEVDLVQSENVSDKKEVLADAVVGSGDDIANWNGGNPTGTVPDASDGDVVLVKDGYDKREWNPITKEVTLVGETPQGPEVGRLTARTSNVAIIGLDIKGDGDNYNGVSVESDNGADSGVVIRNNRIDNVRSSSPDNAQSGTKYETFGILAWSSNTKLKDLVVANNTIRRIKNGSQGFGVFIEELSNSHRGATIENNTIKDVGSYSSGGDTFPGVGVAVLPELTDPSNSVGSPPKIVSDDANAVVYNNTIESDVDIGVSLAGDLTQTVVAGNTLNSGTGVTTEGDDSPSVGTVGITQDGSTSAVSGTARYIQ